MDDLHQQAEEIRNNIQIQQSQEYMTKKQNNFCKQEVIEKVNSILNIASKSLVSIDDQLQGESIQSESGFSIAFMSSEGVENSEFSVEATCNSTSVELQVTDGHWEQINGYLGNWGDWADQKTIYSGEVDEHKMLQPLNGAFLAWYGRKVQSQTRSR